DLCFFSVTPCLRGEKLLFLSAMSRTLDPELRRALRARIRYYNEMGIYDFYRRPVSVRIEEIDASQHTLDRGEEMSPRKSAAVAMPVAINVAESIFDVIDLKPEQ